MSIKDLVENTPIVGVKSNIFAKLKVFNLLGSIKGRITLYILNNAGRKGLINENAILVEAPSRNTGNALAMLGIIKNYKVKYLSLYS